MSQDRKQFIFDAGPNSPCYGCEKPKRYIGCHDKCPEFIAFRKEMDAQQEERIKRGRLESLLKQSSQRSMSETQRRARKARPVRPSQKD